MATPTPWSSGRILVLLGFLGIMAFPIFYWFDENHFNNPAWHIHARFHILWKTMLMTLGGLTGIWLVVRHWEPSIARTLARWVPPVVWMTHFICNIGMQFSFEENVFAHHDSFLWGIPIADIAILLTLLLGITGAILDKRTAH